VQCNQCIDDWKVSDDQYTCIEPTNITIIIIVVAVVLVVGLGLGGRYLNILRFLFETLAEEEKTRKPFVIGRGLLKSWLIYDLSIIINISYESIE